MVRSLPECWRFCTVRPLWNKGPTLTTRKSLTIWQFQIFGGISTIFEHFKARVYSCPGNIFAKFFKYITNKPSVDRICVLAEVMMMRKCFVQQNIFFESFVCKFRNVWWFIYAFWEKKRSRPVRKDWMSLFITIIQESWYFRLVQHFSSMIGCIFGSIFWIRGWTFKCFE